MAALAATSAVVSTQPLRSVSRSAPHTDRPTTGTGRVSSCQAARLHEYGGVHDAESVSTGGASQPASAADKLSW